MDTASLSDLKKELLRRDPDTLTEIILRLAKFKKENKELLNYLLFEAEDENAFVRHVKSEIDELFADMNRSNVYFAKKTIRKVLKIANKYIRFSGIATTKVELLLHFCASVAECGVRIESSNALRNIYLNQKKKIKTAISTLHEDLQFDYNKEFNRLK